MASGKLSPRQKMINMMYLVLTALLALNVSKEILDSFVTVNNGLETTKLTLKQKMDGTYLSFGGLASENPKKYGAAWSDAQEIQQQAAGLVKYIDEIKARAIGVTEGLELDQVYANDTILNLKLVNAKDNQDAITNLMVGSEPANPKQDEYSAYDLRVRLEAFRDKIKQIAGEKNAGLIATVDRMFDFPKEREGGDTGVETSWESKNFYHVPLAAGVTILSKVQTDVRNAENEAVNWLMGDVEGAAMKFSELAPVVLPVSNYITTGDSFRADVYLAGYDPLNPPVVELAVNGTIDTINNEVIGEKQVVPIGLDGKAKLRLPGSSVGAKEWKGIIKFKQAGQAEKRYPFYANYEVAAPNLVVSPTKMNVFYRGIDNPVDVSVPGFSSEKIQPSISNGSITKASGGGYVVRPGQGKDAIVSVSVEMPTGGRKSLPGVEFRVRSVPDPVAQFGGKGPSDNSINRSEMMAAQGVIAKMENFEFDLKFDVLSFSVVASINGEIKETAVRGNRIDDSVREVFKRVKSGQRIWIEDVKAKGPDGSIRKLGALALKVK